MYSTFIIIIAQLIREWLVNSQSKIMFDSLPNVDYLWKLLKNILLVRSECLLELETELYAELIYIHRDPKLLIEKTRDKKAEKAEFKRYLNLLNKNI